MRLKCNRPGARFVCSSFSLQSDGDASEVDPLFLEGRFIIRSSEEKKRSLAEETRCSAQVP